MNDEYFIDRTFELAVKGKGFVSPNPMVGCVVVKDGKVIGEAYHEVFGGNHAEVGAINKCESDDLKGSTLYVNLQPCSCIGKTPPCTDLIIDSGIKRVVYSVNDPNADLSPLIEAGIEVKFGVLEDRGIELNRKFLKWAKSGSPYITGKLAMTLDAKVCTKDYESKWITGDKARTYVHELRRGYDAILVGANTVLRDDPELSLHGKMGAEPHRILLTSDSSQFDNLRDLRFFRNDNFSFLSDLFDLNVLCKTKGLSSVLVEGGAKCFTSFLKLDLFDDLFLFYGSKFLGDEHVSGILDLGLPRLTDAYSYELDSVCKLDDSFLVKLSRS